MTNLFLYKNIVQNNKLQSIFNVDRDLIYLLRLKLIQ